MKVTKQQLEDWTSLIGRKFVYNDGNTLYTVVKVYITRSGRILLETNLGGMFSYNNVDFIVLEITK